MRPHEVRLAGVTMGRFQPVVVEGIDLGTTEYRTQDTDNPTGDGRYFGRDYTTPPTWVLSLATNAPDLAQARTALARVARAWDFARRTEPSAYTALEYEVAGEVRQVFGRPRKFAQTLPGAWTHGVLKATAEFVLVDSHTFDTVTDTVTLTLLPESPLGLIPPIETPIIIGNGPARRQGQITNLGDAPSPLRATIHGPVTNPTITSLTGGWTIRLNTTLTYSQTAVVDTMAHTITRNDGAALAASVSRASDLAARVPVGASEVVFTGLDPSGSSSVRIEWFRSSRLY